LSEEKEKKQKRDELFKLGVVLDDKLDLE